MEYACRLKNGGSFLISVRPSSIFRQLAPIACPFGAGHADGCAGAHRDLRVFPVASLSNRKALHPDSFHLVRALERRDIIFAKS